MRGLRYREVNRAFATLTARDKLVVFSPITSSHPLHELGLDGDWNYWKRVDRAYLTVTKRIIVLTLPGWRESVGVQAELKLAKKFKIPVSYMDPVLHTITKTP